MKDCFIKIGNIKRLNLSHNLINDINGIERLFSLETINLSNNK